MLIAPEWPAFGDEDYRLQRILQQREFDFLVWEVKAIVSKAQGVFGGGQQYVDETARQELVLDYLQNIREARRLEAQIKQIYTDPEVDDPDADSLVLQEQLTAVRLLIDQQQIIAEAIIQDQVAAILAEEGFAVSGQTWPPVLMHMTPLPSVLVTSPRDFIEKKHQLALEHGLSTPTQDVIETAVTDDLNLSALIVPIGGAGSYPTMITESSNINWLIEVTAHEWVHNWLTLKPLGAMYPFDTDVRIINETVASLVDVELGQKIVARYYPEYLPTPVDETTLAPQPQEQEPPAFDFRVEMAETRIEADALLAAGQIQEAENYMEERREVFVENGYNIRKLNQAYFAFYGAYAAVPGGAQGSNPIGPMLRDIRDNTDSVQDFLHTVAPITSLADLEELHQLLTADTN